MKIDLKKLFDVEGESLSYEETIDLSDFEEWGERPIKKPVSVKGEFRNRAGVVTLNYSADYVIDSFCSRCLERISRSETKHFSHTLVVSLSNTDETSEELDEALIVLGGYELDTTELVSSDIILELPIKMLCKEDCKGICQGCGKNLNKEQCVCEPEEWADDRLKDAFDKLFS